MAIRITFVRHANTGKAEKDEDRRITPEGEHQASRRRELLGNPSFNKALVSPLERTAQTARLIAGSNVQMESIRALFTDDDPAKDIINAMFGKLKYSSLRTYHDQSEPADWLALQDYAARTIEKIGNHIPNDAEDFHLLVVGHAVIVPAYGLATVEGCEEFAKIFLDINLGECEGYTLHLNRWTGVTKIDVHTG